MATKKSSSSSNTTNWNRIAGFCAFWSICIAGLIFTISAIIKLCNGSFNPGIFNIVATILMVLGLIIPGWRYSRGKPMWLKIAFWVFAILLIAFGAVSLNI